MSISWRKLAVCSGAALGVMLGIAPAPAAAQQSDALMLAVRATAREPAAIWVFRPVP